MDNLSYRNNRPTSRAASESEPSQSVPTSVAPSSSRAKHSHEPKKRSGRSKKLIFAAIAAVLVVAAAWYLMSRSSVSSAIDSGKFQAVFFTNGQVYFGKLSVINDEYMRLSNVYYLQAKSDAGSKETSPQSASKQDSSDVELIKLGGEIHGPEDAMIVSKDQVLFFENLKPKGNVSQTITNYQSKAN